ncbi:hypothetical protein TWF694_000737 [Orbilia ellipsospora]|uniref:Uncharacterized protein n=1 Tax=Orbilia ellipsospora TaxID=2528407 RepID=A0AAV9XW48_9PEZI
MAQVRTAPFINTQVCPASLNNVLEISAAEHACTLTPPPNYVGRYTRSSTDLYSIASNSRTNRKRLRSGQPPKLFIGWLFYLWFYGVHNATKNVTGPIFEFLVDYVVLHARLLSELFRGNDSQPLISEAALREKLSFSILQDLTKSSWFNSSVAGIIDEKIAEYAAAASAMRQIEAIEHAWNKTNMRGTKTATDDPNGPSFYDLWQREEARMFLVSFLGTTCAILFILVIFWLCRNCCRGLLKRKKKRVGSETKAGKKGITLPNEVTHRPKLDVSIAYELPELLNPLSTDVEHGRYVEVPFYPNDCSKDDGNASVQLQAFKELESSTTKDGEIALGLEDEMEPPKLGLGNDSVLETSCLENKNDFSQGTRADEYPEFRFNLEELAREAVANSDIDDMDDTRNNSRKPRLHGNSKRRHSFQVEQIHQNL